jgi:hypothetical protein
VHSVESDGTLVFDHDDKSPEIGAGHYFNQFPPMSSLVIIETTSHQNDCHVVCIFLIISAATTPALVSLWKACKIEIVFKEFALTILRN